MKTLPELPDHVIEAFHLMWGDFPENAILVHKSRHVMATNKTTEKIGVVKPGMNCSKTGPVPHKGCLADKAADTGKTQYAISSLPDGDAAVSFWIPLEGYPEYLLHFNVGLTMNYKTGTPRDLSAFVQPKKL